MVKVDELKIYPSFVIDVDNRFVFSKADSLALRINENNFEGRVVLDDYGDDPFNVNRNVTLRITMSENEKMTMTQTYESEGKTFALALNNAQNINYHQKDSLLTLSPKLELKKESKWRNQEVNIVLKVPVGTHLFLNKNINNYLQFYYYPCDDRNEDKTNYREWVMTAEGLKCKADLDKPKL